MLGTHFYNQAIRKTLVSFGTLFNNIVVEKTDPESGDVLSRYKVPLSYGPKEKWLTRLEQNPELRKVAINKPAIYFEMTGINYDSSRKQAPVKQYRTIIPDNGNEVRVQYVPVPYTLDFNVGILAKDQNEGLQVLEQILPFFQPNFNVTVNFIPDMNEKKDVAVNLTSVNYSDTWDDNFQERREIDWQLNFSVDSYIYGPYNKADIIRKAIIYETKGDLQDNKRVTRLTYTPKAQEDVAPVGALDGVINELDDAIIGPGDDFGFSGEIELL